MSKEFVGLFSLSRQQWVFAMEYDRFGKVIDVMWTAHQWMAMEFALNRAEDVALLVEEYGRSKARDWNTINWPWLPNYRLTRKR